MEKWFLKLILQMLNFENLIICDKVDTPSENLQNNHLRDFPDGIH